MTKKISQAEHDLRVQAYNQGRVNGMTRKESQELADATAKKLQGRVHSFSGIGNLPPLKPVQNYQAQAQAAAQQVLPPAANPFYVTPNMVQRAHARVADNPNMRRSPLLEPGEVYDATLDRLAGVIRQELTRAMATAREGGQPTYYTLAMMCLDELQKRVSNPPDHDCMVNALADQGE